MATRISETLLKYGVDQGSINSALRANEQVREALEDTADSALELARAANRVDTELTSLPATTPFEGVARDIREAREETDRWTRSLRQADRAADDIDVSRGNRLEMLENVGERSSAVFSAFEGGSELANLSGLLGDAAASFAVLGPAAGIATVGIGGLAAVIQQMTQRSEEAKEAAEDYLARQGAINELIASGATSEDLQGVIERAQEDRTLIQEDNAQLLLLRSRLETAIERYNQAERTSQLFVPGDDNPEAVAAQRELANAQAALDNVFADLSTFSQGSITSLEGLNGAIEKNNTDIAEYTKTIQATRQELRREGVLRNDAAADAEEAADAAEGAAEAAKALSNALGPSNTSADSLTGALGRNKGVVQDASGSTNELTGALGDLSGGAQATAQAAKEAADAQRELNETYADAIESFKLAQADTEARRDFSAAQEAAQLERQRWQDILDFAADGVRQEKQYLDRRRALADDLRESLAELDADSNERRLDIIDDFNEESEDRLEDHEEALNRIREDAAEDIAKSIRDRDVDAYEEATRNAARAIKQEEDQYSKEEKRRLEAYNKQLSDLQESLDDERADRIADYQKRLGELTRQHEAERQQRADDFRIRLQQENADQQFRRSQQEEQFRFEDQQRRDAFGRRVNALIEQDLLIDGIQDIGLQKSEEFWREIVADIPVYRRGGTGGIGGFSTAGNFDVPPLPVSLGGDGNRGLLSSVTTTDRRQINVIINKNGVTERQARDISIDSALSLIEELYED